MEAELTNYSKLRKNVRVVRNLFRLAMMAPQEMEKQLEVCLVAAIDSGDLAETGSVFLRTFGADDKLILLNKKGKEQEFREFESLRIGEGLAGQVASTEEPVISNDCQNDPRYKAYMNDPQLKSFIGVPIICRNTVMGVLCAHNTASEGDFSKEDMEFFQDLANVAAVSILANCNDLTLLPNRGLMNTLLDLDIAIALRRGQSLCLAYIDIDKFGCYNREYGHDDADQLILQLGTLMKQSVGENTTLCHRHGDEFAIICKDHNLHQAEQVCQELLDVIRKYNFTINGVSVNPVRPMTISTGLVEWGQLDTRQQLLRKADEANRAAKREGRDRVVIYQPVD